MFHNHMETDYCPNCGKKLDCATCESEIKPEPGDISVCIYCTSFLIFNDKVKLRLLTDDEIADLPAERRSQLVMARLLLRK